MSQMKKLAIWLAECVYHYHMSDAQILQASGLAVGDMEQTRHVQWLLTQIETMRQYPEIYLTFL